MTDQPDVVVVLADDMGYSDIGCYGGEIDTPNLDALAADGVRLSQFYNTARCSPSRASLMTGLHPHQTGIGILNYDDTPDGYSGTLNNQCVTIAEVLRGAGYRTYLSGKWHMASDLKNPTDSWPTRRGFDNFYGTLEGAGSYFRPRTLTRGEKNIEGESLDPDFYYTDAISDTAVEFVKNHDAQKRDDPLFMYVAYTAPHWPLQARAEDIEKYKGRFTAGWDELRSRRLRGLVERGILKEEWPLSTRDPEVPAWTDTPDKDWEASRMAVYAAQVDRMDQGIGRIIDQLKESWRYDNTLFVFLSDNGGCAEEMPAGSATEFIKGFVNFDDQARDGRPVRAGNSPEITPGTEDTYASYGRPWANLSNSPFREYKHWIHEGGISTPFIARWPKGLPGDVVRHVPHQLPDVMATVLDVTGIEYPQQFHDRQIKPLEGRSMLPTFRGEPERTDQQLFWEHEGNSGVREGSWKLVRKYGVPWELYEMDRDRTEQHDLAGSHPALVSRLSDDYERWAERCDVVPRDVVLDLYRRRGSGLPQ